MLSLLSSSSFTMGGSEYCYYVVDQVISAGLTVRFDIELSPATTYNMYIPENEQWGGSYEHYMANRSGTRQTVSVTFNHDVSSFTVWAQITDYTYPMSGNFFKIDNLTIT